jgi:hypothetical protein
MENGKWKFDIRALPKFQFPVSNFDRSKSHHQSKLLKNGYTLSFIQKTLS